MGQFGRDSASGVWRRGAESDLARWSGAPPRTRVSWAIVLDDDQDSPEGGPAAAESGGQARPAKARRTIPGAYRIAAMLVRPAMSAMTRREWTGTQRLHRDGGFIVVCNHASNIDPLTFAHMLYKQGIAPRFLVKHSLFSVPVLGAVMRRSGQVPVRRDSREAGDSLEVATAALAAGDVVAIFPEGTLTRDPDLWPMAGRTGAARLALASGAPVIPVAQWGAHRLLGRYSPVLKPVPRKRIQIDVGDPVELSDLLGRTDSAAYAEGTRRIMASITELLVGLRGGEPPARPYDMRVDGPGNGREPDRRKSQGESRDPGGMT